MQYYSPRQKELPRSKRDTRGETCFEQDIIFEQGWASIKDMNRLILVVHGVQVSEWATDLTDHEINGRSVLEPFRRKINRSSSQCFRMKPRWRKGASELSVHFTFS